jgi:hypothetical protein
MAMSGIWQPWGVSSPEKGISLTLKHGMPLVVLQ